MTTIELKAQAYDILAQIQFLQSELAKVNQAISQTPTPQPAQPVETPEPEATTSGSDTASLA
jgi:hypothetical protein